MLSGALATGRINPVERNRGPETINAMGILASLAHSANGDTGGESAWEAGKKPRDERWEEARRLRLATRRGYDEQSAGGWIHAGPLHRAEAHE